MARERTKEELLDQAVFAVARLCHYYGPGYNAEGLEWLREQLKPIIDGWSHGASWLVDAEEKDFFPSVINEHPDVKFTDVVKQSRTGLEY